MLVTTLLRNGLLGLVALGASCSDPLIQEQPGRPSPHATSRPAGKAKIPDASAYGSLLAKAVQKGAVDYAVIAKHRAVLDEYLDGIAKAELEGASDVEKLAFYINTYNAVTLQLVLDHIVGKGENGADKPGVNSVSGFFKELKVTVHGDELSLEQIEKLGRDLGDPRIHFAVNCASTSCPALLDRAWSVETLDTDLNTAISNYLASPQGLQVNGARVRVSPILKWYADDFGGSESVRNLLLRYAPEHAKQFLDRAPGFLEYDWSLNKTK